MGRGRPGGFVVGRVLVILCICLASALTTAADPLISPVSQERFVSATVDAEVPTGSDDDSDREDALDFGPFDEVVHVSAGANDASGSVVVSALANQSSSIGDESIYGTGYAEYNLSTTGTDTFGYAEARSRIEITFLLTQESDYVLRGGLQGWAAGSSVTLFQSGEVIHQEFSDFFEGTVVLEWGTLPAGEYTIRMSGVGSEGASGQSQLGGGTSYDITLQFGPLGFAGPGGEVPDGQDVPGGQPLLVDRLSNGYVGLSWGPSCRFADEDYAVYEGVLGDPVGLGWVTCSTGRRLSYDLQPTEDAAWFLVVPTDGVTEGSYGDTSDGVEREPAATACRPQLLGEPVCP